MQQIFAKIERLKVDEGVEIIFVEFKSSVCLKIEFQVQIKTSEIFSKKLFLSFF